MTLTAAEVGEALETHLMGEGLYVTDCKRYDGALHVGYESMSVAEGVPRTEVGPVLRLLLDLAGIETAGRDVSGIPEAGAWEPEDVHVWVFEDVGDEGDEDGDDTADVTPETADRAKKGHYEVREGWFNALRDGYLSETDFSTLVLSTLE